MSEDDRRHPDHYRQKAEIMRQQVERATSDHLRSIYQAIAQDFEARANRPVPDGQ